MPSPATNSPQPELLDYEGRLFAIFDGSRGFLWKPGGWKEISPEFAGRVWASGFDVSGKAKSYGADLATLPTQ